MNFLVVRFHFHEDKNKENRWKNLNKVDNFKRGESCTIIILQNYTRSKICPDFLSRLETVHCKDGLLYFADKVCCNPDAKRLYDEILSGYNKLVRPVKNVTDPVTVKVKLKLSQLIDVVS